MGKPIDSRALAILKKLNLDQKNEKVNIKHYGIATELG